MTRNELIKYLNDNFEADEEINFVYNDDDNDVRTTKCTAKIHCLEKINGYNEWLDYVKDENGNLVKKWIKITSEQVRDINLRRCWKDSKWMTADEICNRIRWVTVDVVNDNKKCLFIDE
jgi:hypothetical protein